MMSTRTGLIALIGLLACTPVAQAQSQSWDKVLATSRRFVILDAFDGGAVLDKETGLVWERAPGDSNGDGVLGSNDMRNWFNAQDGCSSTAIGNRRGWRLPTVQELATLTDPNGGDADIPALPSGHPFSVTFETGFLGAFWSASTDASLPSSARIIRFETGSILRHPKLGFALSWCVRGGQGVDPQ